MSDAQLEICAAVMADHERFEFLFLELERPLDTEAHRRFWDRGLRYTGTLLYKDGRSSVKLSEENPPDPEVLTQACLSFAAIVTALIRQQSQAWLEQLYALSDPREAN